VKKILIIDDSVFSQICSSILELEGLKSQIYKNADSVPPSNGTKYLMVIASYPFGYPLFEEIKEINLPTIVLTDQINREIMNVLKSLPNSYCMIKPIDYDKFRNLVKEIAYRGVPEVDEYNIL
jgi:DNA-binding NtrC family response regulator